MLVFFTLVFLVLLFTFASSASGFLGQHRTCPRCGGIGRDPATLFLTPCPTCGGDGEVGIFMDDEDLEDGLSFLLVGVIVIVVIVGVVAGVKSSLSMRKEYSQKKNIFCPYCGKENKPDAVFCVACGKKL